MYIYMLILGISLIASLVNPTKITIIDKITFVVFGLVSGFRYNVGTDFGSYQRFIFEISQGQKSNTEIGFQVVTKFLLFFGFNDQGVIFFLSMLTVLFFYIGIKYYYTKIYIFKPVLYITFIIFIYFNSFNVVRQMLAAAILFYATKFIYEKSFLKFSMFVLLAMSFHYSSFVFISFYFVIKKNHSRSTLIALLVLSTLLARINFISKLIETIAYNFPILDIGGYFRAYLVDSYNQKVPEYGIVFLVNVLILIFIIFYKNKFIKNKFQIVLLNFYVAYTVSLILAFDFFAFSRFQYYFSIYMVLCVSSVDEFFKKDSRKYIKPIITFLYFSLYVYIVINGYLNSETNDIFPYTYNFKIF